MAGDGGGKRRRSKKKKKCRLAGDLHFEVYVCSINSIQTITVRKDSCVDILYLFIVHSQKEKKKIEKTTARFTMQFKEMLGIGKLHVLGV